MMLKVGLYGAEFFARHGFYELEQVTGNRFLVDIEVELEFPAGIAADDLTGTVNYEQLYTIAEEEMKAAKKLLETVARCITARISREFPLVQRQTVTIKKLNPPLKGKVAFSGVTISLP